MRKDIVTVLGGTGFVGKHVVKHLARAGYMVNVVSRTPDQALELRVLGPVGKVVLSRGNIRDIESIKPYLATSFAAIDLVGIMHESGKQRFSTLHAQAAEKVAKAAKETGVERYFYMSALGVDKAFTSKYAKSKANGEKAVLEAFPEATVLRPALMFGDGEKFFSKFACMARFSPVLPLIGGGETKFQPVYVEDIAAAVAKLMVEGKGRGKILEFGGPKVYTLKEMLEIMLAEIGRDRILLPVPFALASLAGSLMQWLPNPLITSDQVRLLKYDNIVTSGHNSLVELGIKPTFLETVLPDILARYRKKPRIA